MIKKEDLTREIPYIDELPEHWYIIPNRYLFKYDGEKVGNNFANYQLLSLTTTGVKAKDINNTGGKVPENYENYQTVKKGQMVFCLFDLDCSAVFSGISKLDGMITSAYDVFTTTRRINNRYTDYWFKYVFSNRYYMLFSKNVRYTVTNDIFKSLKTPVPPSQEQIKIADFLDQKCSQIDELIKIQEKEIEKLKQYKQAVISEVVTKGLNHKTKMKNSGVEWIGRISENSEIQRLKFLLNTTMQYGANESGDNYKENYVRYIRITDITSDNKLKDDENNVYLSEDKADGFILNNNDILFARSGGTVGKTFLYTKKYGRSAYAGYLIRAKCNDKKLLPQYLMYYTQSSLYETWKNMIFIQATIQNIGANKYSNMEIVLPSIEEQRKIICSLDVRSKDIENLILLKETKIQKLQSYKKSLIYEYVTGKKRCV